VRTPSHKRIKVTEKDERRTVIRGTGRVKYKSPVTPAVREIVRHVEACTHISLSGVSLVMILFHDKNWRSSQIAHAISSESALLISHFRGRKSRGFLSLALSSPVHASLVSPLDRIPEIQKLLQDQPSRGGLAEDSRRTRGASRGRKARIPEERPDARPRPSRFLSRF